jgi:(S)-2-hydroxyglutarate dehydrogenase
MSRSGDRAVRLATTAGSVEAGVVITCAGLHSDRLARMTGGPVSPRIVPFRVGIMPSRPRHPGSYAGSSTRCPSRPSRSSKSHERRLVLAREGYGGWDVNLRDLWETLSYIGFRILARRYWRTGLSEVRGDLSKPRTTAYAISPRSSGRRLRIAVSVRGGSGPDPRRHRVDFRS